MEETHLASSAVYYTVFFLALVAFSLWALLILEQIETYRAAAIGTFAVLEKDVAWLTVLRLIEAKRRTVQGATTFRARDVFTP